MAKLAIFIDGGYYSALSTKHYKTRFDFPKFTDEISTRMQQQIPEPLEILRTFYYDCLPYQSKSPSVRERELYANKNGWFNYLQTLPKVQLRRGVLAYRGIDTLSGQKIFQQKKVDLLLGLDFAEQSTKHLITHLALVAGDSDYCPAVEFAKRESVSVWLFHGAKVSPATGESTYAQELWDYADVRVEIDKAFIDKVKR